MSYTRTNHGEMKVITCNLPRTDLDYIQKLMDFGVCPSRSEYIRVAVRERIHRDCESYNYMFKTFVNDVKPGFIKISGYNGDEPVKILRRLE